MLSFAKWCCQVLIVTTLLTMRLSFAACPAGFVEQNNMCVQLPPTCPANYVLYNGLCYPANQVPLTPVVQGSGVVQPCNRQPAPVSTPCNASPCSGAVQPCNAALPAQPCNVAPVQPCNVAPVQPCNAVVAPQPCNAAPAVQPCNAAPVQPCNAAPVQPCNAVAAPQPCNSLPVAQPCNVAPVQPCNAAPPAQPCNIVAPTPPCSNTPIPPPPNVVYPIYPTYPTTAPITTPSPVDVTTFGPIEPERVTTTTFRPVYTTYSPPPDPITQCPEGTIIVKGVCRLIYCHKGIFKDNTCIQTVCPEGTVWTGIRCAPPEPVEHSITYNHTIYTNFNHSEPDVIINNVNNVVVNASIELPLPQPGGCTDQDCNETPLAPQTPPTSPPQSAPEQPNTTPCCNVMTPRVCEQNADGEKWNCYSKRYRQCGHMCVAPTIYLRPPRVYQPQPNVVVVPPNPQFQTCRQPNSCQQNSNMYDCSGCASGFVGNCSPYCYNYRCGHRRCAFYDQQDYCSSGSNGGAGCTASDGCYENWCDTF